MRLSCAQLRNSYSLRACSFREFLIRDFCLYAKLSWACKSIVSHAFEDLSISTPPHSQSLDDGAWEPTNKAAREKYMRTAVFRLLWRNSIQ
jgi:hypothetical protein